ncbi:uncharacterized protein LOC143305350 isoform X2 [Osmia lignaria lignaria]|uniref:uncharacterized protein LOC143305350 isoform X2 n=1 Tax=Osmia lignaria lignaria TaxID=1437193 RepID=UPI00402B9CA1
MARKPRAVLEQSKNPLRSKPFERRKTGENEEYLRFDQRQFKSFHTDIKRNPGNNVHDNGETHRHPIVESTNFQGHTGNSFAVPLPKPYRNTNKARSK